MYLKDNYISNLLMTAINSLESILTNDHLLCLDTHTSESNHIDIIKTFLNHFKPTNAFYIVDLSHIIQSYQRWVQLLPRVKPFYSIKCNPNLVICRLLSILGAGFDLASRAEYDLVANYVHSDRLIYSHPCKDPQTLEYLKSRGVDLMVVDNPYELDKIKTIYPSARLLVRIKVNDRDSQCPLNRKFGLDPSNLDTIHQFFQYARQLNLQITGVSFHVGSNCRNPIQYQQALEQSRQVFDIALSYGYQMSLLDIGGGFTGQDSIDDQHLFEQACQTINQCLDQLFAYIPNLQVIAEPGRYFVQSAQTLVFQIIGKSCLHAPNVNGQKTFSYYINDSLYGSFNCIIYDHAHPTLKYLPKSHVHSVSEGQDNSSINTYPSIFYGQTCDSLDLISQDPSLKLPELSIGDYGYVVCFGAYTNAGASTFNGFPVPAFYYLFQNKR